MARILFSLGGLLAFRASLSVERGICCDPQQWGVHVIEYLIQRRPPAWSGVMGYDKGGPHTIGPDEGIRDHRLSDGRLSIGR